MKLPPQRINWKNLATELDEDCFSFSTSLFHDFFPHTAKAVF